MGFKQDAYRSFMLSEGFLFLLCGVFSCLVLSAEKLGQESQCLQVVSLLLCDLDCLIKGAELFLRILFSLKQNL